MQITDLHANILPYDYFADRPAQDIGLARTAGLAAQLRAEAANALLLDNGDFLQGNPLADYFGQVRGLRPGEVHPVIAAMNAAGVEVATLGNHDFDYGLDFLHAALAGAGFPVVSANVLTARGATPADDRMLVAPWVILDRHLIDEAGHSLPIRVGVIGFAPPQITRWSHPHLDGRISARDIMQAARAQVPALRAAGADLVIALCHSGLAEPDHVEGQENAGIPLAGVEGIDVVLAGHQHLTLPGPAYRGVPGVDADAGTIRGKPAVMAGFWGGHLGVIDLALGHDRGRWRILDHDSRLYPIAARQPDGTVAPLVRDMPAVTRAAAPAHAETLDYVRRPVGRCTGALHSYFALAGADPCVALLAQAQRAHVRQALKGTEHDGLPILSAVSPFKAGGRGGPEYYSDVPAGDLAIRHVADLYPYPNTVQAVRLTGAQVRAWLERAASLFNRIVPGQPDQMLMERDAPAYQFDVLDGLRYRIDLGQPARFDALGGPGNPQGRASSI
ncbi:bifunctional 2',3'-cyclic-nucleotide 2'-phosphodiesterase/3'-nucleotidase [Rhodovulum adriaticum]|nr:bifunctional 2',3'-cyclic-nucleotide 2'-phosphodiesterase/3'-nucleotidase [Rhodovulum adriaticum]